MPTPSKTLLPEQLAFDFDLPSQPSAKPEPLLTVAEACALFNLKPHVLRRAIKRGAIPRYSIGIPASACVRATSSARSTLRGRTESERPAPRHRRSSRAVRRMGACVSRARLLAAADLARRQGLSPSGLA